MGRIIKRYSHNSRDPLTGRKAAEKRSTTKQINIIKDIEPYQSMMTGERITSRSHHREHLKEHGVEEVGNERPQPKKPTPMPDARPDIAQSLREKGLIG